MLSIYQKAVCCEGDPLEDDLPVLDLAVDKDENADQKSGQGSEGMAGITRRIGLAQHVTLKFEFE